MRRSWAATLVVVAIAVAVASSCCQGQALPTASGPGSYLAAGGGLSGFNTDYGHHRVAGGFAFVDVNPTWRLGFEGEVRYLRLHTEEQVTETNYLGGIRVVVSPRPRRWEPYVKFVAGAGRITLPFGYAHGGFLAYAPGAGVDFWLSERVSMRVAEFEYQHWPQFPYGALHPYGVSAGLRVRLNEAARFPRGRRARH